jgi:hypothetical protein
MGLLKYSEREDFATAARYLQLPPGQGTNLAQLAKEFQALHTRFKGDIALLSDDPNGTVEAGLPPGEERAGVFAIGGTTTDVILVRVDDPAYLSTDEGLDAEKTNEAVRRVAELRAGDGFRFPGETQTGVKR